MYKRRWAYLGRGRAKDLLSAVVRRDSIKVRVIDTTNANVLIDHAVNVLRLLDLGQAVWGPCGLLLLDELQKYNVT
jgi:hypothetical protein